MWSFKKNHVLNWFPPRLALLGLCFLLTACQFQPLYGSGSASLGSTQSLSAVSVSSVNTRVGQQVRNHLLFLMNGGVSNPEKTHEARIRVTWSDREIAAIEGFQDSTSGIITVITSYELVDLDSGKAVARGQRTSEAQYERFGQVFANNRAIRDAENRAAKEVAESLRHAIASDLKRSAKNG